MKLLEYLDARAARRDARRKLLLDRGVDWRNLLRDAIIGADPKFLVAMGVIGLFAWAFARADGNDLAQMQGALIAAFAGAWGFYLGSSSSAKDAGTQADKALDLAQASVEAIPKAPGADVTLEPGETAQARP